MWDDEETLLEALEGGLDFSALYHAKQRALTADQGNFRVVIGGRRSGKTLLIACEALELADQFPGETIPYVGPTVGRARDILMPHIRKLDRDLELKLQYNLGEHKIYSPAGGCIQLCGLATEAEVEKGRGGSSPVLYIDECGHINQRLLQRAVKETYGPATRDWMGKGGRGIMLSGTPDYVPLSYWSKLCGGNAHKSEFGASVHHMTIWDNPFYAGREESVIDAYCTENKLERSASEVQREWYGRFAIDSAGLAYPGWKNNVLPMSMMPRDGYTTLGVDLGSDHPCAWVVIRWTITESIDQEANRARWIHHGHVLESYEESGLNVHDVYAITRSFQQAYGVSITHGDSGGGGALTIAHLQSVMGLAIDPVKKAKYKQDQIWMLDSMLANGTLHVHDRAITLIEQLGSVPKERRTDGLWDHMSGYADHSLDACHYAILAARQQPIEIDLGPRINQRKRAPDADISRAPAKGRGALLNRLRTRRG